MYCKKHSTIDLVIHSNLNKKMSLFQRIIRNILPHQLVKNEMNPSTLFLSFISPKQFFTVISRKVIEHSKSNMYDIWLDSLETAVWREGYGIKMKELDTYYGYMSAANINGNTLYSPGNIWVALTIICGKKLHHILSQYEWKVGYYFLMTVYLMMFIFSHKIKVFPYAKEKKEKNFKRFIWLFFSLFAIAAKQNNEKIDSSKIDKIKNDLLKELEVFFMLFWVYQRAGNIYTRTISDIWFYQWMFSKQKTSKPWNVDTAGLTQEFIWQHNTYSKVGQFSKLDEILLQQVLPQDILIKYIYHSDMLYVILEKTISPIYSSESLDPFLRGFLHNDDDMESFLSYILNYQHFKNNFFSGMQATVRHIYNMHSDYIQEKEVDEFFSMIQDSDSAFIGPDQIPDILQQESQLTEKLLNFYVSYIWGLFVARGDSMYSRRNPQIVSNIIIESVNSPSYSKKTLQAYGKYLIMYAKNQSYYEQALENVQKKKDTIDHTKNEKKTHITSNISVIHIAQESMWYTVYTDHINRQLQMTVSKKIILKHFQSLYGTYISSLLELEDKDFVKRYYTHTHTRLDADTTEQGKRVESLEPHIWNIKETLYMLDNQIYNQTLWKLTNSILQDWLDPRIKLSIAYTLKETLLWYMLWSRYASSTSMTQDDNQMTIWNKNIQSETRKIYIYHTLGIQEPDLISEVTNILIDIELQHQNILKEWLSLDDNTSFLNIVRKNATSKIHQKDEQESMHGITPLTTSEKLRFKNCLQHITYYNKRTLKGV